MIPVTVLLAEDHQIVRAGFRAMLALEGDLKVVGEAANGREAVPLAASLKPDVVLMDIAMPLLNGLEAARQLRLVAPACRVLILSAHSDDAYVQNALDAGAAGFLLKQSSLDEVCRAIRAVHQGQTFFSRSIAQRRGRITPPLPGRAATPRTAGARLTSREMEVIQLIAEGSPNKQIAAVLKISVKTVEKHRAHLMEKLDIHDTAGITRYAIGAGIIESCVQVTTTDEPSPPEAS